MNKQRFPYIALGIGLFALLILLGGQTAGPDGERIIPLLGLLLLSELAFFVTAAGTWFGIERWRSEGFAPGIAAATTGCGLMALVLARLGMDFWPL